MSAVSPSRGVLTVRALSGLSGDMMLTGLTRVTEIGAECFAALVAALHLSVPTRAAVVPCQVHHIAGWGVEFGPWPSMTVERRALVYGDTVFDEAPNGSTRAWGEAQ